MIWKFEGERQIYGCKSEDKVQYGLTEIGFNFSVLDSSGSELENVAVSVVNYRVLENTGSSFTKTLLASRPDHYFVEPVGL